MKAMAKLLRSVMLSKRPIARLGLALHISDQGSLARIFVFVLIDSGPADHLPLICVLGANMM